MDGEDDPGEIISDAEVTIGEGRSDREQNIHQIILRIERLFITGGLRMDFLTPAVLLIVLGSSVAYADSTPTWWDGGLEDQFGVELSVFLLLISGFIIIANIFLIFILEVSKDHCHMLGILGQCDLERSRAGPGCKRSIHSRRR